MLEFIYHFQKVRLVKGRFFYFFMNLSDFFLESNPLSAIFHNPRVGIAIVNSDLRFLFVNDHFADLMHLSNAALLQRSEGEITVWGDVENSLTLFRQLFSGEILHFSLLKRYQSDIGGAFVVELTATPLKDMNGNINGAFMVIVPLSARELPYNTPYPEDWYRQVLNGSPDTIAITDLNGVILFASSAAVKMFGYPDPRYALGKSLLAFIYPEDRERALQDFRTILEGNSPAAVEYRGVRADGSLFFFEVHGSILRDEQGAPQQMIFVLRDVTQRHRAENDRQQRIRELEAINATMVDMTTELDLQRLLEAIVERVALLLGALESNVALYDPDSRSLRMVAAYPPRLQDDHPSVPLGQGIIGKAAQSRKTLLVEDVSVWETSSAHGNAFRTWIAVPLLHKHELLGVVTVSADPSQRRFSTDDLRLIEMFAQSAAIAIQNATLFSEVQRLARLDSLTGALNRRSFYDQGQHEIQRAQRYHSPLSLIMLDVDHFKQVNDRYGHLAGDEALKAVVQTCLAQVRQADWVGRFGGEEFVILLPETSLEGALAMAQRLCTAVETLRFPGRDERMCITISVGVAERTLEMTQVEQLLNAADEALYRAKAMGRNRVSA
ncbi:putative signaling protein [Anaerolinea thermophila UNI-1]|uniref:Signaling protein n=2 Tax=Anaerolinea thermophila TaxID=167964 RepID=E8N331_ANATU|nr:putative signaling protein [Anaerolinea thermophila UNI-1]